MSNLQKTNAAGFVIDMATGAVLNTDNNSYQAYKAQIAAAKDKQELQSRILYLEQRISRLETILNEVIANR